ncbi:hypothetical protein [Phytohabitans kaempferiae]|uniref:TM2 domain-containing protein n=1 Tax=Phytohabitans kaempferiae TaxID=1620943 RepID=A0ABV6LUR5_9ACTN
MTSPPPGQDPYQYRYQDPNPYGYPTSGVPQHYSPSPYAPAPYSPGPYGYAGSYGFDPLTGLPYSDKSRVAAGLLQLLPGFLIGLGGIGRLYAGNMGLGIAQIVLTLVGWISFWCGFLLVFPFIIYFGLWLWFTIDGIVVLAGRPMDGQGRLLR